VIHGQNEKNSFFLFWYKGCKSSFLKADKLDSSGPEELFKKLSGISILFALIVPTYSIPLTHSSSLKEIELKKLSAR
jgi:hypothetical protein